MGSTARAAYALTGLPTISHRLIEFRAKLLKAVYHRNQNRGNEVPRVLAVVRAGACRDALEAIFHEAGWDLRIADTTATAAALQIEEPSGVVLYQRELTDSDWGGEVARLAKSSPQPWVVLLSGSNDQNLWDEVTRHGASDILRTPLCRDAVLRAVQSGWVLWRNQQKLRIASGVGFGRNNGRKPPDLFRV